MDVPGLNPAKLTDEQLLERINQCRFNASRVQHQPGLLNSVIMILDALEAEYHERLGSRRLQEEQQNSPQVIEIGTVQTPTIED